ncbi:MAG: hypothetical protein AAB368_16900 [bacterium]
MATWLEMLRIELENLGPDDLRAPIGPVKPEEHRVGEADLAHQRMYGLAVRLERAAAEAVLEAKYAPDQPTQDAVAARACELSEKANKLREVFWVSLKDAFRLWDKPAVGLRAGWAVVWFKPEDQPQLDGGDFFRRLLGGR